MGGNYKKHVRSAARAARRYGPYLKKGMGIIQATQKYARKQNAQKAQKYQYKSKTQRSYVRGTSERAIIKSASKGISYSSARLRYKPMDHYKSVCKDHSLDRYRINDSGIILSKYGEQGFKTIFQNNLVADQIQHLFDQCIKTSTFAQQTFGQGLNNKEYQFWLDTYKCKTTYTNQGPSTIKMTIYDILCKADEPAIASAGTTPEGSWLFGMTKISGIADATAEASPFVNSKPTDSPQFRQYYRILKTTHVQMQTGSCHEHNFTFTYKGKIPMSKIAQIITNNPINPYQLKGITTYQLAVIQGMPCDDVAAYTDVSTVTLDRAKVIYTTDTEVTTRLSGLKSAKLSYFNNYRDDAATTAAFNQNPDGQGVHNTLLNVSSLTTAFS